MYTARIGDAGVYTLADPYSTLVTPKVIYTVRSIRTIGDILASGELAYDKYYKVMKVSEAVYAKDAAANISIIGLQAGTGEWIYVPETFIKQAPLTNGVLYSSIVLGVGLGAVPDELNLEALTKAMQDIVQAHLGITPKVRATLVSQPAFIPRTQHESLEKARKAKIKATESDYSKVQQLQTQLDTANKKIAELEKYIKAHL